MIKSKKLFYLGLIALNFLSCKKEIRQISILSDNPQMITLIDLYNNSQQKYSINLTYLASNKAKQSQINQFDIVLLKNLQNSSYLKELQSLEELRTKPSFKTIYPSLIPQMEYKGELKAIPLAFDLPIIYSKEKKFNQKIVDWSQVEKKAQLFNRSSKRGLTHLGFSPLLSETFLRQYILSDIKEAKALFSKDSTLYLNKISALNQWIDKNSGGIKKEIEFNKKYAYIPNYRLVLDNRILFSITDLSDFFKLPHSIHASFSGHLLSINNQIIPFEISSIGVLQEAPNPEGALDFLTWLLKTETYESYLKTTINFKDQTFGYLGGLSANEEINKSLISDFLPEIRPYIPNKEDLKSPETIPPIWTKVKQEILLPNIKESLSNREAIKSLSDNYTLFLLQNPNLWQLEEVASHKKE